MATECKGGVIESMGFGTAERRHTFYAVCLPVRLCLVLLVGAMISKNAYAAAAVVFVCAMISVTILLRQAAKGCKVWWSRRVHAMFAALLAVVAMCSLFDVMSPWSIIVVMMMDWIYSLASSFVLADF